ncbi:unnamed protein product [Symbiodinium natans]|uniref:Uncharacterized protein n=1 Tax=Symbiodinium natans TaxID=878477 RepID=A0A812JKV1_9DINO|nr:unnamed protein product [Symbiodinium natans]
MRRSLALLIFESRGDSTPPPKELSLGEGYLDSLPLSHEGVRRDTYFSSTAFPRSCEGAGANYGLSDEGLPWTQGRAAFRKYVASESPTLELQAEMSTLAWDLSHCWCTCGSCHELLQVCPLGTLTALNLMRVASSVNVASRVASFANTVSVCSHMDPYVLITRLSSHWPELLLSSWPIFGSMYRLAMQVMKDGLHEGHLDGIFAAQVQQAPAEWGLEGRTWVASESFCGLLGFRSTMHSCPLIMASALVRQALELAQLLQQAQPHPQAIDAIETLVGRAQLLVQSVLPSVPGVNECMKSQNLFLGLSLSLHGLRMFKNLMLLQDLLEGWLYVLPAKPNRSSICPASQGTRWQGEWLTETDFLKDFESQLSYETLQHQLQEFPAPPATGKREAWVCTLFAGPEVPESQVATHAELIRTLAHSVRRHSWHSRPFVVLTQDSLPELIRRELLADGFIIEYFDASPLLMRVPEGLEWKLSWFEGRHLTPTMGQLAVWNLTSWDTLVMLDDDMLMLKPADELFSIPVFAMSHDPSPVGHALDTQGQRTRLNNAARVVQPSAALFNSMVEELQSGLYKNHPLINFWGYDLQTLEDAFWSQHSRRSGLTTFDSSGSFQGCTTARPGLARRKLQSLADSLPDEAEVKRLREFEEINSQEKVHCVLPVDYNFFVDFKSVFHLVYHSISQEELRFWSTRKLMRISGF